MFNISTRGMKLKIPSSEYKNNDIIVTLHCKTESITVIQTVLDIKKLAIELLKRNIIFHVRYLYNS